MYLMFVDYQFKIFLTEEQYVDFYFISIFDIRNPSLIFQQYNNGEGEEVFFIIHSPFRGVWP